MHLEQVFQPSDVLCDVAVGSKRQVLSAIASSLAQSHGLDARRVFDVLHEREQLGSTAIGDGVAIPHARVGGIDALAGCVVRLQHPLPFDAHDEQPVDLIAALLAPESGGGHHLRVLARLSRLLRDASKRAELRNAADSQSLWYALAVQPDQHQAA